MLFYIASMLKPLISSLDKTEIRSFKWIEHKPLEATPEAAAAVVLGRCLGTLGPPHSPCAHEAPILLFPLLASALPDPVAGQEVTED